MKKTTLPILVTMIVSLVAVPAAWAGGGKAADLSRQCQEAVKTNPKSDGAKLCQEGLELHKQGKNDEAIAKMQQGLAELQPAKAPTGKPY
jgi:hypothetical protein